MKKNKMTREDKRRLLFNKKNEKNTQANKGNFARPDGSCHFLRAGSNGTATRAPFSKRMIAIIVAIVMVLGLIPAGIFVLKPKAEEINTLGSVEMILRVNGTNQGTVQMAPGKIEDHISSVTIDNAPAKLEFEGAFMVDRGSSPVTETRIASVGAYQGNDYYSLYEENDTGIKKKSRQELVLVYSSEYDVTTNPGDGTITVDEKVPYGTDLHVTVTAPKGYSISEVTYVIGENTYTASPDANGDFTIPGSQVINDIEISATYSQFDTFTVKDARKVQNSKYYNLYGLEGHGGVTATIGMSAAGQPYDNGQDFFEDWSANKYQLFTSDAVRYNQQWDGRTYNGDPVYGAPATSLYGEFNNITNNSNGTIKDIQPNSVANGASTTFYLYSQSKSGNSNGWSLNALSINGETIDYPVGTTIGSSKTTTMKDGTNVTVTLTSTDSPLYWNNGDISYNIEGGLSFRYFSKSATGPISTTGVSNHGYWYYKVDSISKHRTIYQVDIDSVQDNLEVAYNFKDIDSRKIIITGLNGIEETGAAYEWRGDNVTFNGSTSTLLPRLFESRNYYYTSASNPATSDATDLNDWKQNEYDAFFFEQYGGISGATYVPSANVYAYRVKNGYNPYTVEAKARYIDSDNTVTWVEGEDLLAGPREDSIGAASNVIVRASEGSNEEARRILENTNLPDAWIQEGGTLDTWVTEFLSFNSRYRFWGTADNLQHGDMATRGLTWPAYSSSTHNQPDSAKTEDKLFLTRINSYESALQNQDEKNYRMYALALQQNEAKDQLLQLNAHPYQYTMVFDANGGEFTNIDNGYSRLANNEFADTTYYTSKSADSVKSNTVYTMADGPVTTHMPKRSMQPERTGYYFAGWKLYVNNAVVDDDEYDEYYLSNYPFTIDDTTVYFTEGNEKVDENHTFTFKAEWIPVAPESDMVNVSVSVYKQNGSNNDYEATYEPVVVDNVTIENKIERQIAGETVLLNQYKPSPSEYYVLDEELSQIYTETRSGSDETDSNNQLKAYFKWRAADLTVKKRVNGNPKALKDGFEITIILTKDEDSPVRAQEAAEMIVASNPDNLSLEDVQVSGDTVTFKGTFGRSTAITLNNVPYGWTATVSEPKAATEEGQEPDYTTTIATDPEDLGTVSSDDDKTFWTGRITKDTEVTVTNASESYLILDKTIARNENGKYDLTLDAFSTGDVTTETIKEKVPTDFILVVDQSGSMAIKDMATKDSYIPAGTVNLETAATGNYYYTDENGDTYRVYGKKGYLYKYYPANGLYVGNIVDYVGAQLRWFMGNTEQTLDADNMFYVNDGGKYYPVHMTIQGKIGAYYIKFYYLKNGQRVDFNREDTTYTNGVDSPWYKNVFGGEVIQPGWTWGTGLFANYNTVDDIVQGLYGDDNAYTYSEATILPKTLLHDELKLTTGMFVNYDMYLRKIGYTGLYYRDAQGVEHVIKNDNDQATTEFCNNDGNAIEDKSSTTRMNYSGLQTASQESMKTRLEALQDALNQFTDAVANQSDDIHEKVDNRIAIVGFAGTSASDDNDEILTNKGLAINADPDNNISAYSSKTYSEYGMSSNYSANDTDGYWSFPDGKNYIGSENDYVNSLLETKDDTQLGQIRDAISAVTAYGGTQPEYGLEKAKEIYDARTDSTYESVAGQRERNKVVVFFTDGEPGDNDTAHRLNEANDVIEKALDLKEDNVTIFSVGVFGESDAEPLTYDKYQETSDTTSAALAHEYELGYWKKVKLSDNKYHYLNRYWMSEDADNYGAVANDTIFDYMSAVSSNYPAAEEFWDSSWTTSSNESWLAMTERVRDPYKNSANEEDEAKKALSTNKYYRMATSQEALIAAFLDIAETESADVTTPISGMSGTTAILRDVINGDDFEISEHPEQDYTVRIYTQKGKQRVAPGVGEDAASHIDFLQDDGETPNEWVEITNAEGISYTWGTDEHGNAYVDVAGFDYGANYIAKGKLANHPESSAVNEGTVADEGKKLIVVVSGLAPKQNATGTLKSNTDDSGIYKLVPEEGSEEPKAVQMDSFTSPTMYRYKYDLTEPSVKTVDEFDITFARTGTESILVTYGDNDSRSEHFFNDTTNDYVWQDAKHGDAIYWELLENETNNQLKATVPAVSAELQEEYTYSLALIDSDGTNAKTFDQQFNLKTENSTIQVTKVSNYRDVTIKEETRGVEGQADFSDRTKQFPIHMKVTKANDAPFTGDIEATITRSSGETETVTLHFGNDGELNNVNDVKLADGDKIDFQIINGYTLKVWETEEDADTYTVTYNPDEDGEEVEGTEITISDTNAIKVINTLTENPVITGFNGGNTKTSTILFAIAGIVALGGGAWLLVQYKRKKEEALEAYKNSLSE